MTEKREEMYVRFTFARMVVLVFIMSVAPTGVLLWLTENDWRNDIAEVAYENDVAMRNASVIICEEGNQLRQESNNRVPKLNTLAEGLEGFLDSAAEARRESGDIAVAEEYEQQYETVRNIDFGYVNQINCSSVFPEPDKQYVKNLIPIATLAKR